MGFSVTFLKDLLGIDYILPLENRRTNETGE